MLRSAFIQTTPEKPQEITAELVRKLFDYDPETGVLRWLKNQTGGTKAGEAAGSRTIDGYIRVRFARHRYHAHRIAWLHFYGTWPSKMIDHINRNRDDNRIANLRLADDYQNQFNRKVQHNSSGFKGVRWHKRSQKWISNIRVNGALIHLGSFDDKELAASVYRDASIKHHGEYSIFYNLPQEVLP